MNAKNDDKHSMVYVLSVFQPIYAEFSSRRCRHIGDPLRLPLGFSQLLLRAASEVELSFPWK